ncbi:MAG: hypothetical protein K5945_10525 [Bacteroidaceae bacterium]|nr:hypothetical protein [Bacteroidaceae bacterium]
MGFVLFFILWFAIAIILTVVIEYGMLRLMGECRRRVLRSSIVINIITNLTLNITLLMFVQYDTMSQIRAELIGEAAVVAVEALWYAFILRDIRQAGVYSLLCNAVSYLGGMLLQLLLGQII